MQAAAIVTVRRNSGRHSAPRPILYPPLLFPNQADAPPYRMVMQLPLSRRAEDNSPNSRRSFGGCSRGPVCRGLGAGASIGNPRTSSRNEQCYRNRGRTLCRRPRRGALQWLSRLGATFAARNAYGIDLCERLHLRRWTVEASAVREDEDKRWSVEPPSNTSSYARSRVKNGDRSPFSGGTRKVQRS